MGEREHKGRNRAGDGSEQIEGGHSNPLRAAAMRRRMQERRAGGPAKVDGERGGQLEQQGGDAAAEQSPGMLDVFSPSKSSDEELGHDEHAVKAQADAMRTALQKHFDDFQLTVATALKIVLAGMAGLKKSRVRTDPLGLGAIGGVAKTVLKLAWAECGGEGAIKEVVGIAKEELLGAAEHYSDVAKELITSAMESGEPTVAEVLKQLVRICTDQTNTLVERGKKSIPTSKASNEALATTWRLITGTRDNMTDRNGDKLDGGQKEAVTTMMLEQITEIKVGGAVAMQIANTIGQQAEADFTRIVVGADAQADAVENALSGGVVGEMESAARATKDMDWIEKDKERRASVKVGS